MHAKVYARSKDQGLRILMEDHKRQSVEAAREFLLSYKTNDEQFSDSIVTGDKTWVHSTTPEIEEQCHQWKYPESPKLRKFKQRLNTGKVMASAFWDRKRILLCEFMLTEITINADRYCEALKELRHMIENNKMAYSIGDMLTKAVRFHQDNTDLINQSGWETVTHSAYSLDSAPNNYRLFPELK